MLSLIILESPPVSTTHTHSHPRTKMHDLSHYQHSYTAKWAACQKYCGRKIGCCRLLHKIQVLCVGSAPLVFLLLLLLWYLCRALVICAQSLATEHNKVCICVLCVYSTLRIVSCSPLFRLFHPDSPLQSPPSFLSPSGGWLMWQ